MRFVALVHKDPDTDFGVSFPDVPGCTALGKTYELALDSAAEALAFHIEGMLDADEDMPIARPAEDILADPELTEDLVGATLAIVPLVQAGGANLRINLSIDSKSLAAIDDAAKRRGMTRSAFIAETGLREARRL
ncbi:MAG: ribbon-helix-helix protein, CopG family [Alphaproteobacteria bacterium]|nr:ribbon-helix-helix protein, CopG family [Alphaproteobacteria bacterium]